MKKLVKLLFGLGIAILLVSAVSSCGSSKKETVIEKDLTISVSVDTTIWKISKIDTVARFGCGDTIRLKNPKLLGVSQEELPIEIRRTLILKGDSLAKIGWVYLGDEVNSKTTDSFFQRFWCYDSLPLILFLIFLAILILLLLLPKRNKKDATPRWNFTSNDANSIINNLQKTGGSVNYKSSEGDLWEIQIPQQSPQKKVTKQTNDATKETDSKK